MKHLGDITKIKGCNAPVVDCVIGGSPCQDLSIAGKRAGLAGERSGLYMEQIRIVKEMRHKDELRGRTGESVRPRYMVWENVPGAFSSNQGKDFAAVIEEAVRVAEPEAPDVPVPEKGWPTSGCFFDEMGKWSIAWRVMDAQFWGVPQRRRRICLVCDFNGLNAPKIVFGETERHGSTKCAGGNPSVGHPGEKSRSEVQPFSEGLSRDLDESEQAGKATAGDAGEGSDGADCQRKCYGWPLGFRPENTRVYKETATTLCNGTRPGFTAGVIQSVAFDTYNMDVSGDKTVTLRAGAEHNYAPVFQQVIGIDQQGGKGGANYSVNVSPPILSDSHGTPHAVAYSIENHPADSRVDIDAAGKVQTLTSRMGTGGGNVPMVMEPKPVYCLQGNGIDRADTAGCNGKGWKDGTSYTLNTIDRPAVAYQVEAIGFDGYNQAVTGDKAKSLTCKADNEHKPIVYYGETYQKVTGPLMANSHPGSYTGQDAFSDMLIAGPVEVPKVSHTLRAKGNCDFREDSETYVVGTKHIVRRLTPLECERLQGFPDGWTDIGEWVDSKGKKHKEADSPRYKALGNSIAIPPWKWVLKRLCACYERDATMASLFDGIGGFPYIWEQLNGKGSCLWASEIEEFPMAVTKVRFG